MKCDLVCYLSKETQSWMAWDAVQLNNCKFSTETRQVLDLVAAGVLNVNAPLIEIYLLFYLLVSKVSDMNTLVDS